jgi:hypothetical protein
LLANQALLSVAAEDADIVLNKLLLPLASFNNRSEIGDTLLAVLLEKAKKTLPTDLSSSPTNLPLTSHYLALCKTVLSHGCADPSLALQFYATHLLSPRLTLETLDSATTRWQVLESVAESLALSEKAPSARNADDDKVKAGIANACPDIFDVRWVLTRKNPLFTCF